MEKVIKEAKKDEWCKLHGGFCIALMPSGEYDYFPTGMPPHVATGGIKRCGEIVAAYIYSRHGFQPCREDRR